MVTNKDIIPSKVDLSALIAEAETGASEASDSANEAYDQGTALAARFFSTEQGILYFLMVVLLIIFLILKNTVLACLGYMWDALWSCCCKSSDLKTGASCPCIYKEYPVIDL